MWKDGIIQNPEAAPSLTLTVSEKAEAFQIPPFQVGSVQNPDAAPSLDTAVKRECGRLPTSALTSWKCPESGSCPKPKYRR